VLGKAGWSGALEVRAGDVIKHQLRLEAEEVAQAVIQDTVPARFVLWQPKFDGECDTALPIA
jgi:hypothetical protein